MDPTISLNQWDFLAIPRLWRAFSQALTDDASVVRVIPIPVGPLLYLGLNTACDTTTNRIVPASIRSCLGLAVIRRAASVFGLVLLPSCLCLS